MKGNAEAAIRTHIKAAWYKWRQLASILTRRDIPIHLRTRIYGTIIRPVMLYGAETWPVSENIEQQINRTDRKMLRWMHRVQLNDRIPSVYILKRSGLRDISINLAQRR